MSDMIFIARCRGFIRRRYPVLLPAYLSVWYRQKMQNFFFFFFIHILSSSVHPFPLHSLPVTCVCL